jgi:hypothetical protein
MESSGSPARRSESPNIFHVRSQAKILLLPAMQIVRQTRPDGACITRPLGIGNRTKLSSMLWQERRVSEIQVSLVFIINAVAVVELASTLVSLGSYMRGGIAPILYTPFEIHGVLSPRQCAPYANDGTLRGHWGGDRDHAVAWPCCWTRMFVICG